MAIPEKCDRISALLARVKRYNNIVVSDSFTNSALSEMKGNCRDIIKDAKDELNEIKKEVDSW